jgi:tetratricopeptide (TPR) repeat protein
VYYAGVVADYRRALLENSIALKLAPDNAELLGALGRGEVWSGRWEAGRLHLERAVRLDPRSIPAARSLAEPWLYTRHYPQAEQAFDRALELKPANLLVREERAMVAPAQGDLSGAGAILHGAPTEVDPTSLVATVGVGFDLWWVLPPAQQQLLVRFTPGAFEDDRAAWGAVLAQTYWLRGDLRKHACMLTRRG